MGDREAERGAEPKPLFFIPFVLIPITWKLTSSRSGSMCNPMAQDLCFSLEKGQASFLSQVLESHSSHVVSSSRRRELCSLGTSSARVKLPLFIQDGGS